MVASRGPIKVVTITARSSLSSSKGRRAGNMPAMATTSASGVVVADTTGARRPKSIAVPGFPASTIPAGIELQVHHRGTESAETE